VSRGRIPVAVLGATGIVGQRFVSLLADHPWFEPAILVGRGSVGKAYGDAVAWQPEGPVPLPRERVVGLEALRERDDVKVVFSALPGGEAGPVESALARSGRFVFTNARDHRLAADVPLLVPEVNPDHLEMVRRQPGPGWIVANGNCSAIILTLAVAPLARAFGIEALHVTTLQGLSGAGHPGVSALDIVDNVVPFIPGEEEKLAAEPAKMLGELGPDGIAPAPFAVHATCTRVPVRDGHLESVHLRLARPVTLWQVEEALRSFAAPEGVRHLPSSPRSPLLLLGEPDRPQPRPDRMASGGMAVSVGRLRLSADGRDLRLVALGHNAIRGAAGQSVLNAEQAHAAGLLRAAVVGADRPR
jgi:aspartate-semialdehyde dehydrogenase